MLHRRHLTHIVLNIASIVVPMLAAVAVIPGLTARLGHDRFGALVLVWTLIGYFGLLDLGLGRALTQYLAKQQAAGTSPADQAATAAAARSIMVRIGFGWALLVMASAPWIPSLLRVPEAMATELQITWAMLAAAIPLLMWTASSVGALEARSRFVAINAIRLPQGVATFLLPWAMAQSTTDLRILIAGLLVLRLVIAATFAWVAREEFQRHRRAPAGHLRGLLTFGGWLTISNLVGPLLSSFDRFAIAAVLSMAAVTYYTVPFDALSRLPSVAAAMMSVLFPLLAHAHELGSKPTSPLAPLVHSATQLLLAFWLPLMVALAILGPWLLHWWVPSFADASLPVWQWLTVGALVNGFAHVPYSLLQSAGRTDWIARIHLVELPLYGLGLWWALLNWGIAGAAVAWTLRVVVDAALLYVCACRYFPHANRLLRRALFWACAGGAGLAMLAWVRPFDATSGYPSGALLLGSGLSMVLWCLYHLHLLRRKP